MERLQNLTDANKDTLNLQSALDYRTNLMEMWGFAVNKYLPTYTYVGNRTFRGQVLTFYVSVLGTHVKKS